MACRTFGAGINLCFFHCSSYPRAVTSCGQTALDPVSHHKNDYKYPALDLPVTPVTICSDLQPIFCALAVSENARAHNAQNKKLLSGVETKAVVTAAAGHAVQFQSPTGRSLFTGTAQIQCARQRIEMDRSIFPNPFQVSGSVEMPSSSARRGLFCIARKPSLGVCRKLLAIVHLANTLTVLEYNVL